MRKGILAGKPRGRLRGGGIRHSETLLPLARTALVARRRELKGQEEGEEAADEGDEFEEFEEGDEEEEEEAEEEGVSGEAAAAAGGRTRAPFDPSAVSPLQRKALLAAEMSQLLLGAEIAGLTRQKLYAVRRTQGFSRGLGLLSVQKLYVVRCGRAGAGHLGTRPHASPAWGHLHMHTGFSRGLGLKRTAGIPGVRQALAKGPPCLRCAMRGRAPVAALQWRLADGGKGDCDYE